jgi:hypothetical protein
MNRHQRPDLHPDEAILEYHANDFAVVKHGTHVRCGVTGARIELADLRYWSAERQEAYATREAVLHRLAITPKQPG